MQKAQGISDEINFKNMFSKIKVLFKRATAIKIDRAPIFSAFEAAAAVTFAFLTARAAVFSSACPFAVAFCAALWDKPVFLACSLSASLGYALKLGSASARYQTSIVALYICARVMKSRKNRSDMQILMPLVSAAILSLASLVFSAAKPFAPRAIVSIWSEGVICLLASFVLTKSFYYINGLAFKKSLSRNEGMFLFSGFFIAFSALFDFNVLTFSVGRTLSVVFLILISMYNVPQISALFAGLAGFLCAIYDEKTVFLFAIYIPAAILSSLFAKEGKGFGGAAFFGAAVFCTFLFSPSIEGVMCMWEIAVAAALAAVIPKKFFNFLDISQDERKKVHDERIRHMVSMRLRAFSSAIYDIFEVVSKAPSQNTSSAQGGARAIADKAINLGCRKCPNKMACWGKEYGNNYDGLLKVVPRIMKLGRVEMSDMPPQLMRKCTRKESMTGAVNSAYSEYIYKKGLLKQMENMRKNECEQYMSIAKAMESAADDFAGEIVFDASAEGAVESYMRYLNIPVSAICAAKDECGREWIEMTLKSISDLKISADEFLKGISRLSGFSLTRFDIERRSDSYRIILSSGERYDALYAMTSKKKHGERVCGDTSEIFKTSAGKLVMLLCDGMGVGVRAAQDSALASSVVRRIMKSGFKSDVALRTADGALKLKNPGDERVTSLDLCVFDLYSGCAEFVKAGSPPTYIRRDNKIIKVEETALPAGFMDMCSARPTSMNLRDGDIVLMVSDGVISEKGDKMLEAILKSYSGVSMREISQAVVEWAEKNAGGELKDDITVMAMQVVLG